MAANKPSVDLSDVKVTLELEDQATAEGNSGAGQDMPTQVQGVDNSRQDSQCATEAPAPAVAYRVSEKEDKTIAATVKVVKPFKEILYTVPSFGFYNGHPIGLMNNANLTNIDGKACAGEKLALDFAETSLRSDVTIMHQVYLKPAPRFSTPVLHTMRTIIPAKNIRHMQWIKASDKALQALPDTVKLSLKDVKLVYEDLSFLEITATSVQMSDTNIPPTLVRTASKLLNNFTTRVNQTNKLGHGHKFVFIVLDTIVQNRNAFSAMAIARERSFNQDPLCLWIHNSPQKLHRQLGIGNIHPPPNRPPMSIEGLVLRPKRVYQDELELKVYLTYAITIENDYARACNAKWGQDILKATFAAMPGTSFKDHEGDNDLPKQYLCHIKLSKSHKGAPDVGTWVQLDLFSFALPLCPKYEPVTDEHDDGPADDTPDNGDDYQTFNMNSNQMHEIHQCKLDERNAEQARYWRGQVVCINDGDIEVVLQRPIDPRWKGPKEIKPRVNTEIPTYATNFRYMARLKDEQKKAVKHDVLMKSYYSEQGYKDLVAGITRFTEAKYTAEQLKSSAQAHLSKYLITRDPNLVLDECDLFGTVFSKDWQKFTSHLSPYQIKRFQELRIDHGLTVINGCVASAKTSFALITAACAIENPDSTYKVLCTVETNLGVDSTAKSLEEILSHSSKPRIIIRILPQKDEMALVISKDVAPNFRSNFEESYELLSSFLGEAETHLYNLAQRTNEQSRLGDKRRTSTIRNLTLSEVMWAELSTETGNKDFGSIKSILRDIQRCPDDHMANMNELEALLPHLANHCIRKADAIVCTISNALKPSFIEMVSHQINFAIIDEAGNVGHAAFLGLVGSYQPVTWVLDGDDKQQGVYFPTHLNKNFWNPFSEHGRRSALTIANEVTTTQVSLMEQHRMFTGSLTDFLGAVFYSSRLLDGNANKAKPGEYLMFNDFLSHEFRVEGPDNWVFFYLNDSWSSKQEIGTSTFNVHHQHAVVGLVRRLIHFMELSKRDFDKQNFSIEVITPYKAQTQQTSLLLEELKDPRVQCNTISKVQGIGRNITILDLTNGEGSTKFSDDPKNTLVGSTRHKHGVIILASEKATRPDTYGSSYKYAVEVKHTGKFICWLAEFARDEGRFKKLPLPNLKGRSRCGNTGHTVSYCTMDRRAGEACYNCMAFGHSWSECPDGKTRPDATVTRPARSVKSRCRRCRKIGHMKAFCPEPYCKKCDTIDHTMGNCPNKNCDRCNTTDHWFGEDCPKFKR